MGQPFRLFHDAPDLDGSFSGRGATGESTANDLRGANGREKLGLFLFGESGTTEHESASPSSPPDKGESGGLASRDFVGKEVDASGQVVTAA